MLSDSNLEALTSSLGRDAQNGYLYYSLKMVTELSVTLLAVSMTRLGMARKTRSGTIFRSVTVQFLIQKPVLLDSVHCLICNGSDTFRQNVIRILNLNLIKEGAGNLFKTVLRNLMSILIRKGTGSRSQIVTLGQSYLYPTIFSSCQYFWRTSVKSHII